MRILTKVCNLVVTSKFGILKAQCCKMDNINNLYFLESLLLKILLVSEKLNTRISFFFKLIFFHFL